MKLSKLMAIFCVSVVLAGCEHVYIPGLMAPPESQKAETKATTSTPAESPEMLAQREAKEKAEMDQLAITAAQGDEESQFKLGKMYWDKEDAYNALLWFCRAAKLGSPYAQFVVGSIYSHDEGLDIKTLRDVPVDYTQAHMWFAAAAQQGMVEAQEKAQILSIKLSEQSLKMSGERLDDWTNAPCEL